MGSINSLACASLLSWTLLESASVIASSLSCTLGPEEGSDVQNALNRRTFWNRDFLLFWLGSMQSELATAVAGVAFSFLVLEQTGKASSMGITLALSLLPSIFAPLMGAWIDRLPLKPPLILGNLLRAGLMGVVAYMAFTDQFSLGVVYLISLINGLVDMFYTPASQSVFPTLVPPEELQRASGYMGMASQGMQLVGLVGGGFLVGVLGSGFAIAWNAVALLVMSLLLLFVALPVRAPRTEKTHLLQDTRAALQLVKQSAPLRFLMLLTFVAAGVFAPLELMVPKIMLAAGQGSRGYGLFFGTMMGAMLLGSALVATGVLKASPRAMMFWGLLGMVLAFVLLSFSSVLPMVYASAGVLGLGIAVAQTAATVLEAQSIPEDFRGRVFSLYAAVAALSMPVVLLLVSAVIDHVPVSVVALACAAGMLLLAVMQKSWLGLR
ncbi:MFS transporter [Deinococcus cellulosilyticus]|uniref:MFS transporter n=1 Tax=Deinococcus cellulosilyticus TaxID=401558 RepID=UPI0011BE61B1|nr:MFS transporter [Deinococcus cellulosilyticus]